jgi:predicted double-glycine peptidase
MKKIRYQRKFRLLGDQAIEGKRQKKISINRWLYTHKKGGIFRREDKKLTKKYQKKTLSSSHTLQIPTYTKKTQALLYLNLACSYTSKKLHFHRPVSFLS